MHKARIMVVLGIRPDFIRMSVLLRLMAKRDDVEMCLVATGQHYDAELKDVFFDELKIPRPLVTLDTSARSHSQQHAKLISHLEQAIDAFKPDVCLFLGDANAVMGCITALKKKVPIAHIEAGMRSFNWDMPEERNRVIIDRVSDVLYTYHDNYKINLVREGINPTKIVTVGNIIVDVVAEYLNEIKKMQPLTLAKYGVAYNKFALMTLHRDEHVSNHDVARHIIYSVADWTKQKGMPVIWPRMPRTQAIELDKDRIAHFTITKPLGFIEFMALESAAKIEFTDSGSNQEVAALVGTPCVVTRMCTERPETFSSNISTMELNDIGAAADWVVKQQKNPSFFLGDGGTSSRILNDLVARVQEKWFSMMTYSVDPFVFSHFTAPRT